MLRRVSQQLETWVASRRREMWAGVVPVASGKRDKTEVPAVKAPFHAPFQELGKALKARPAAKPVPSAIRPTAPAVSSSPPPAPLASKPPPSDAEVLAESLAGVSRISQISSRVMIRRKPDLSHIEAKRREDLDAMARAEGFDVTFEDHYVRARSSSVSRETLGRLVRGEFPISAHLDLHRMPLEEARRAVDEFLVQQQKRGHRCVLLVTGKGKNSPGGQGVLREHVPQWLARGPSARRVLAFASARPCDGGLGALVVLMRGGTSSKNRIHVEHGGVGPLET